MLSKVQPVKLKKSLKWYISGTGIENNIFPGDAREAQDLPLSRLWQGLQRPLQPDEAHARAHWGETFCLQGGYLDIESCFILRLFGRFVEKASGKRQPCAGTR